MYVFLNVLLQVPGQGPTSYLDAAQREKALQSMQQMSSAQIVSATANMHPRYHPRIFNGKIAHFLRDNPHQHAYHIIKEQVLRWGM